jgi:hypothetical protein
VPNNHDGQPYNAWPLVSSYVTGDPAGGYAQTFRDHVAGPSAN